MPKSLRRRIAEREVQSRRRAEERLKKLSAQTNRAEKDAAMALERASLLRRKQQAEAKRERIAPSRMKQILRRGEREAGLFGRGLLRVVDSLTAPAPTHRKKRTTTKTKRKTSRR